MEADLELELLNFHQLDAMLASCGQPRPDQFGLIARAGYAATINLATSLSTGHLPDEPQLCRAAGLDFTWRPVDWERPTPPDYLAFEQWLAANRRRKVLVHCAKNWRASVFCFLYRVRRENVPPGLAWRDVLEVWEPDPVWSGLVRRILEGASPV